MMRCMYMIIYGYEQLVVDCQSQYQPYCCSMMNNNTHDWSNNRYISKMPIQIFCLTASTAYLTMYITIISLLVNIITIICTP